MVSFLPLNIPSWDFEWKSDETSRFVPFVRWNQLGILSTLPLPSRIEWIVIYLINGRNKCKKPAD